MATHSSILGWRIPWTGETGELHSPWVRKGSYTKTITMGRDAMISVFLIFSFKLAFSLSSFSLIKKFSFLVPLHLLPLEWYHLHIWGCWCFSCLSWFQLVISSLAFLMMCLAYRLNKQGDSRQPCHTPFLIFNQSVLPYSVLTVVLDLHTDFSGDR